MKHALIKKLHGTLSVPIYDGVVQAGLEIPSCVVLPVEYRVVKKLPDGAEVEASVTICAHGMEERVPLILCALTTLPQGERAYRGENITAKEEDHVMVIRANYRVRVTVSDCLDAPMMEQMDLRQEEE